MIDSNFTHNKYSSTFTCLYAQLKGLFKTRSRFAVIFVCYFSMFTTCLGRCIFLGNSWIKWQVASLRLSECLPNVWNQIRKMLCLRKLLAFKISDLIAILKLQRFLSRYNRKKAVFLITVDISLRIVSTFLLDGAQEQEGPRGVPLCKILVAKWEEFDR